MAKSSAWANSYLLLTFNNVDATNVGNAGGLRGSTVAGSFYLSLHSSDPGVGGSQTTNELTYSGYTRFAVARSNAGFVVTANVVALAGVADFPEVVSGTGSATHFACGELSTGAGVVLYSPLGIMSRINQSKK